MTVPPPPWRSTPRSRKPALSQDLVVKTALEILAEKGLEALTMRRVATELGTGPASLYAHVANKDELTELMLDAVLADIPVPEPDPKRWTKQAKDLVKAQIAAMMAYRGIARAAWDIPVPVNPHALRLGEAMLAILRAGGLTLKQATFAGDALSLYAKAYAYEGASWRWGEYDQNEVDERGRQMDAYMQSLPPTMFPNMLQIGEFFNEGTARERLDFALDIFLAGLKTLAQR